MSSKRQHPYDSHRCEGSLAAHASIRRWHEGAPGVSRNFAGVWRLEARAVNSEWMTYYMRHVAAIRYCPWCGEELR